MLCISPLKHRSCCWSIVKSNMIILSFLLTDFSAEWSCCDRTKELFHCSSCRCSPLGNPRTYIHFNKWFASLALAWSQFYCIWWLTIHVYLFLNLIPHILSVIASHDIWFYFFAVWNWNVFIWLTTIEAIKWLRNFNPLPTPVDVKCFHESPTLRDTIWSRIILHYVAYVSQSRELR